MPAAKRLRNSGPSPFKDEAEYRDSQRRGKATLLARAHTAAGKLAVEHGGSPDDHGQLSIGHGGIGAAGQRIRYGHASWRADELPERMHYLLPTMEGLEAAAAYILSHRLAPTRSNPKKNPSKCTPTEVREIKACLKAYNGKRTRSDTWDQALTTLHHYGIDPKRLPAWLKGAAKPKKNPIGSWFVHFIDEEGNRLYIETATKDAADAWVKREMATAGPGFRITGVRHAPVRQNPWVVVQEKGPVYDPMAHASTAGPFLHKKKAKAVQKKTGGVLMGARPGHKWYGRNRPEIVTYFKGHKGTKAPYVATVIVDEIDAQGKPTGKGWRLASADKAAKFVEDSFGWDFDAHRNRLHAKARRSPSLPNPRVSKKAIRAHLAVHMAKLDAENRAKEADANRVKASKPFTWSAPVDPYDSAGACFLRSAEDGTYWRYLKPYLKETATRISISIPPSASGQTRYAVHSAFASSDHPQAWKPRNAFDAWADLTGGLDGPGGEE